MRLYTIPLSHYCERARWALDWCGVVYEEEQHLQMFHRRPVRRYGGPRTMPVLETAEGALLDSADIVRFADERGRRRLYPAEEAARAVVEGLEAGFTGELGVEVRRWVYLRLLPERRLLLRYNAGRAPRMEQLVLRLGYGMARKTIVRYLGVTAEKVERGLDLMQRGFDEVARRLDDGRPYLGGDRFGAADLTFAAMAAFMVFPAEYGMPLPPLAELPAGLRDEVSRFRAHPAGKFTLRLFRDHRAERP